MFMNIIFILAEITTIQLDLYWEMQHEKQSEPNIKTMWGCMFAADLASKNFNQKVVAIVGDSRIGKSTLFNYLLGATLEGYYDDKKGQTILRLAFQGGNAVTANTFDSVTLIPNSKVIKLGKQNVSLIDLAGFNDQGRSYVGRFGVSYVLDRLFQRTKEVKFLFCATCPVFQLPQIQNLIKPFQNFAEHFQAQTLLTEQNKETLERLANSISLVVCKANIGTKQIIRKIQSAIQHLQKNENSNSNNSKLVIKILKSIAGNKRIQLFKKGQDEVAMPSCTILQNLSKPQLNWNFYDFQKNLPQQYTIKLPFKKSYSTMLNEDRNKYSDETLRKQNKIKESYQILKKLSSKAKQNWYIQHPIDYQQQFQQIRKIVNGQPYGDFKLMVEYLGIKPTIPMGTQKFVTRLPLLANFRRIHQQMVCFEQINEQQLFIKFQQMLVPCRQIFTICKDTFCNTRQHEQLFIKFMFINIRSLYEAQMQNKIDKQKCAGIPYAIQGPISTLLPQIFNLMAQFVCDFKPNDEQQAQYQNLLLQIIQKINNIQDPAKASKISQKLIKLKIKFAEQFIKTNDYFTGLRQLLQAYQTFKKYLELLQPLDQQPEQIKQYVQYKHISIIKKIALCAQQLNLGMLAVKIYEQMQSVHLMMKCYEKMIENKKEKNPRYDLMYGYIEELKKYGNKGKVITMYQQMIDQFECFPKKRSRLRSQLSEFLTNSSNSKQFVHQYAQRLNANNSDNFDVSDVIEELKQQLNVFVPQGEHNDQGQQEQEDEDQVFQSRNEGVVQDN